MSELEKIVNDHFLRKYHIPLSEMEITDVPGYWQDREAKMHPHHPLHLCIGCSGPFKGTYTYFDFGRKNGRFSSRYETWKKIKTENENAGDRLQRVTVQSRRRGL